MSHIIRIVLVRPRDPLNIGACARAMANFGLSDLVVVDPYEPVWRETRSAPEAEDIVLKARLAGTWEEAVEGCRYVLGTSSFHQRVFKPAIIQLPDLHSFLDSLAPEASIALVFGSERSGLSNAQLALCRAVVQIPTNPKVPSMNLGQSVAVVLYELRCASKRPLARNEKPAPRYCS